MAKVIQDYNLVTTSYALTVSLASLADGSFRQSLVEDNIATNKFLDCIVGGKITVGTTPIINTLIRMWLYASWDTSDYTGGASGTDIAYTAGQEGILVPMRPIKVSATTSNVTYEWMAGSVRRAFGEVPPKWGVIIKNESGVALNSTAANHDIRFWGIKKDIS